MSAMLKEDYYVPRNPKTKQDKKNTKDHCAQIIIYDLPTMNEYRKVRLIQWLRATADGLKEEDQKDFAKIYRLTLMK